MTRRTLFSLNATEQGSKEVVALITACILVYKRRLAWNFNASRNFQRKIKQGTLTKNGTSSRMVSEIILIYEIKLILFCEIPL